MRHWTSSLLLTAVTLLAGCGTDPGPGASSAGSWAQWRGADGAGVTSLDALPVEWGPESDNLKWKVEPPARGVSQPIVSGERIYLTGARGVKGAVHRSVMALDIEDGELLWETVISKRRGERLHHRFGSFATPTPVTDGETIWAYFGGYLAAISSDGEQLWRAVVDENYWSKSRYGAASSPVLAGDAVIVFGDDEWGDEGNRKGPSWLAAYDRKTGDELWRNQWDDTCCSYSTPLVRRRGGSLEVIVATTPLIIGFDALTGERLWDAKLTVNQVVPSLVMADDILIQAGSVHRKGIAAYRLTGAGAQTSAETLWEEVRAAPDMASPVIYDGLLYTVSQGGVMTCFEPEDGEVVWRKRLPKGDYRSAMVAGEDKLYLMTTGGKVHVLSAGRKFELLATNDFAEYTESSITVSEECFLIRTKKSLYCVGRGSETATS